MSARASKRMRTQSYNIDLLSFFLFSAACVFIAAFLLAAIQFRLRLTQYDRFFSCFLLFNFFVLYVYFVCLVYINVWCFGAHIWSTYECRLFLFKLWQCVCVCFPFHYAIHFDAVILWVCVVNTGTMEPNVPMFKRKERKRDAKKRANVNEWMNEWMWMCNEKKMMKICRCRIMRSNSKSG